MKSKRIDYEVLRLIAIFGVVFNHTQYRGYELFRLENCGAVNFYGSLVLGILCKTAVPLFFMVSGGLLLHKDEPIRTLLKKRVLRIMAVLVLFSVLEYLRYCVAGYIESPNFWDFAWRFWETGVTIPYWYLYTYLGLLLMLPLLRPMVRGMRNMNFIYLIILHFLLYGVLNSGAILFNLGDINGDLLMPLVESSLFYFILGYYFAHRFPWEVYTKRHLLLSWVLAVLSVLAMLGLAVFSFRRDGALGFSYMESLMVFPVVAVYQTAWYCFEKHKVPEPAAKVLSTLGSCVFGAYLLEGALRYCLDFVYTTLEPVIHVLPAALVWVASVVVVGLAITWVLKKLPILKKLL